MTSTGGKAHRPRILVVGNANVDVVIGDVAPWPVPGTEVTVDGCDLRVGGAAGNTALALAALGVEEGRDSDVVAGVGDDQLGRWLEEALEGAARLSRSPKATALTVCLTHPDSQRTFVSYLGHLEDLPRHRLDAALAECRPGDLLLVCGYFLLPQLRSIAVDILRDARQRGVVTLLDTGWPDEGWTASVRAELERLLPHLDAFLPNRDEALGCAGLSQDGDIEVAVDRLLSAGAGRVVVKLGPEGALIDGVDGRAHAPAHRVTVHDTVGAGDTFNAGLVAGLQRGLSWAQALQPAVAAASLTIASSPRCYPSFAEVSEVVLVQGAS